MSAIVVNQELLDNKKFIATSDKYIPITTQEVIDRFSKHGFEVSAFQQANYRKQEKHNKVKHLIRMKIDQQNGIDREVVIMNSYDSSTSLKLNFGLFRMVCLNQMVLGDSILPETKIKHTTMEPFLQIDEYADSIQNILHKEADLRAKMEACRLSPTQVTELCHQAMKFRDKLEVVLDPRELNIIRRPEDRSQNLWTSYNRVQEALMKGLYQKQGTLKDEEGNEQIVYKKAKKLTDQSEIIKVNKKLHDLYSRVVA